MSEAVSVGLRTLVPAVYGSQVSESLFKMMYGTFIVSHRLVLTAGLGGWTRVLGCSSSSGGGDTDEKTSVAAALISYENLMAK